MLEKMFRRKDVCDFIEELLLERCNVKRQGSFVNNLHITDTEQSLFMFFDSLFKYQIIIETDIFLDEYIAQVRKLFKKLDNFYDINLGVSKIIGKLCALKFNISDREDSASKRKILEYVYDKYIVHGYLFHGFSGVYKEQIKRFGFVPEQYQHSYAKFVEVDKIFNKHRFADVMGKNFQENFATFTDDFMMGCYYGVNSPMYFSRLLSCIIEGEVSESDAYFKNDYFNCFRNLNKLMRKAGLSDYEKKYVTRVCTDEWKTLQKGSSNIHIMLVSREKVGYNYLEYIDDIFNSNSDLGECILQIISPRFHNIVVDYSLTVSAISFIEIPNYKYLFALREKQDYEGITKDKTVRAYNEKLMNTYGKVSVLILLGALLITLGVVLTIITISKGM